MAEDIPQSVVLDEVLALFRYDSAIAYGRHCGKYPADVIREAVAQGAITTGRLVRDDEATVEAMAEAIDTYIFHGSGTWTPEGAARAALTAARGGEDG